MKYILFIILSVAACASWSQKPNILPFDLKNWGGIEIKGVINDTIPTAFIFDTGGGINLISKKRFNQIKASATFKNYYTGFRHDGDRMDFEIYEIPSLSLGSYKVNKPLVGVSQILDDWGVDAIISLVSFANVPITIDYSKKELRIETNKTLKNIIHTSETIPVKVHQTGNLSLDIFVTICLNNTVQLDAEFDTGTSMDQVLISSKFLNSLSVDTLKTKNWSQLTPLAKKPLRIYNARLDSLRYCGLDGYSQKNIGVEFKDDIIYEGLVGAGYFKNTPFTIDVKNQKIYVQTKPGVVKN